MSTIGHLLNASKQTLYSAVVGQGASWPTKPLYSLNTCARCRDPLATYRQCACTWPIAEGHTQCSISPHAVFNYNEQYINKKLLQSQRTP